MARTWSGRLPRWQRDGYGQMISDPAMEDEVGERVEPHVAEGTAQTVAPQTAAHQADAHQAASNEPAAHQTTGHPAPSAPPAWRLRTAANGVTVARVACTPVLVVRVLRATP